MSKTNELLDRVKERRHLTSDAALGRAFSVAPSTVSNYRQGTRHPEPEIIERLATALDESPIAWAMQIQAEREAKLNPQRAKVWLRWASKVAGVALAIALTTGIAPAHATTTTAPILQGITADQCILCKIYGMSTQGWRGLWCWWITVVPVARIQRNVTA